MTHNRLTDAVVVLTDTIVRAAVCPDGKTQTYLHDAKQPGFAVRLRAGGSRSFVYFSTRPGQKGSHKIAIGPFPKIRVEAARKQAAILAGDNNKGVDLVAAKRDQKQAARRAAMAKAATLGALVAKDGPYETDLRGRTIVAAPSALSALRRNLLPEHRHTDLNALTRLDITSAMDSMKAAGKSGAAGYFRKSAMTFLNWAVAQGYVAHNVMAGYREQKKSRAEKLGGRKAKGRMLTDDEIRAVWDAAGRRGTFGLLVRMCLLGGPRRSEPTMIEWSKHVMPDRITFDAHWTKMGLHHDIPRTVLVDEVLEAAKHFQRATGDLVFPSSKTGGQISGFTKLLRRLIEEAGTAPWTMHDLRRSLRSIMNKCGYDNEIQRLCVGQKPRGIDAVYNLDEQWVVRKMAFEAAHRYLAAAIEGKSTDAVRKHEKANNPQNARKLELLARLAALHAEG
jgi:integrase